MVQEREEEILLFFNARHGGRNDITQFIQSLDTTVGQLLALDISPKGFNRIEIGGIARQLLDMKPFFMLVKIGFHDSALMGGQPIPNENDFLFGEMFCQVFQEKNQTLGLVSPRSRLKQESAFSAIPAISQGRTQGQFFPVKGLDQDGGVSPG